MEKHGIKDAGAFSTMMEQLQIEGKNNKKNNRQKRHDKQLRHIYQLPS